MKKLAKANLYNIDNQAFANRVTKINLAHR